MNAIRKWLEARGFGCFTVVQDKHETYEDHPVSIGGIRIEICDDVASVWCISPRVNEILPTSELQTFLVNTFNM
jgi:hypothetical protein